MTSETSRRMYCSDCKKVTEHVKMSTNDLQGVKDVMEEYARRHPESLGSGFYQSLPDWFKTFATGYDGTMSNIINGISNFYLKKDYRSLWICSICKRPQYRTFE